MLTEDVRDSSSVDQGPSPIGRVAGFVVVAFAASAVLVAAVGAGSLELAAAGIALAALAAVAWRSDPIGELATLVGLGLCAFESLSRPVLLGLSLGTALVVLIESAVRRTRKSTS